MIPGRRPPVKRTVTLRRTDRIYSRPPNDMDDPTVSKPAAPMRLAVPPLRKTLAGAYFTRRALFLSLPVLVALYLSFLDTPLAIFRWYSTHYIAQELRARFVTSLWLAAAVLMSFFFSIGTLKNVLRVARIAPGTLRHETEGKAHPFFRWLGRSQILAVCLVATFAVLFVLSCYPSAILQEITVIVTGVPLVLLIASSDYAMYRAFQCADECTFLPEEAKEVAHLRQVLGDSGRILVYVDAPVLMGLLLITSLKLSWHFHPAGIERLYIVGFTGGAIAMHLILGNLISLLLEYLDRTVFVAEPS